MERSTRKMAARNMFEMELDEWNAMGRDGEIPVDWHGLFDQGDSSGRRFEYEFSEGENPFPSVLDRSEDFDGDASQNKVSDAVIFGPRFCTIFHAYEQQMNKKIDVSGHLMTLCLDNLVDFIGWARESEEKSTWISSTLLDNRYLRPEVRNGIVMVLIYTFASIKATTGENLDMFKTLQDTQNGLAIANKFSLKIYNDPFNYLTFLKNCITSLIDAGCLPDNERVNQPKKSKLGEQNVEELTAFRRIADVLITLLESGKNSDARSIVTHIVTYWQLRGKFIRNKRFVCGLNSMKYMSPQPAIVATVNFRIDSAMEAMIAKEDQAAMSNLKQVEVTPFTMMQQTGSTSTTQDVVGGKRALDSKAVNESSKKSPKNEDVRGAARASAASMLPPTAIPSKAPSAYRQYARPLRVLRFERVGAQAWEIKEVMVPDSQRLTVLLCPAVTTSSLLTTTASPLCLIDELVIAEELGNMSLHSSSLLDTVTLHSELRQRRALLTSWPHSELRQFLSFVAAFDQRKQASCDAADDDAALTLQAFWRWQSVASTKNGIHGYGAASTVQGCLAYEVSVCAGLIVRANPAIGLLQDHWCCLHLNELHARCATQSFGAFLEEHLPQLKRVYLTLQSSTRGGQQGLDERVIASAITVKYAAASASNDCGLPELADLSGYQTIGVLASPASKVIASLGKTINITKHTKLQFELKGRSRYINSTSDSEIILNIFAESIQSNLPPTKKSIFSAVRDVMNSCNGGFAVLLLIHGVGLVAFRDPNGIRPLSYGVRKNAGNPHKLDYAFSSENIAFEALQNPYVLVRDLCPGEAMLVDTEGALHAEVLVQEEGRKPAPCLFEYIYFARPDTILDGALVAECRANLGAKLAEKIQRCYPHLLPDIDVVMPIPETSRGAALQVAARLQLPYSEGFVKNRYIARTFIMSGQAIRERTVKLKFNTIRQDFLGKRVILVDDSIVRGTTSKELVRMARAAGALKVYFASTAPPIRHANVYGIDIPTRHELVAHGRTEEEVSACIEADAVIFNDLADVIAAVQQCNPQLSSFDASCFDGIYATGVEESYLLELEKSRSGEWKPAPRPCNAASGEQKAESSPKTHSPLTRNPQSEVWRF